MFLYIDMGVGFSGLFIFLVLFIIDFILGIVVIVIFSRCRFLLFFCMLVWGMVVGISRKEFLLRVGINFLFVCWYI